MSDGKEETDRTKPPKDCQYVTWCNDCEEAVTNEDAACVECSSLDLEYFIRESDHDRIVADLTREQKLLVTKVIDLSRYADELRAELVREQVITDDLTDRLVESHERNRDIEYSCQELRSEVERLSNGGFVPHTNSPETKQAIDKLVDDLENVGRLRETIATQAREAEVLKAVIEKLREQRKHLAKLLAAPVSGSWGELIFELDKELASLEKEGAKG